MFVPQPTVLRGWVRLQLIRELALGEKTSLELGEKYGMTAGSIRGFATRNKAEIEHVKANIDDEYAGLWIADKRNRIAEYEADVGQINTELAKETDDRLIRTKAAVLRQAAEELGQLTQKVETTGQVNYTITGIDPAVLK